MNVRITKKWNEYLVYFQSSQKDIYYCEEYVKLYEDSESSAYCIICEENGNILMMPFLRRRIQRWFDFETPYGYGGFISNSSVQEWIDDAFITIKQYFVDNSYVCGFIRFHPLIRNHLYCTNSMVVLKDRETVTIVTSLSEEEIWYKQLTSKNRNMIRKAEKNGLIYKAEYDFSSLNEFIELYKATMSRLNADAFYFFDESYFRHYVECFRGHSFLGTIRKDGQLICAALFMYSDDYGHYHLEGSNHEYSNLGANNFLLWMTALEFRKHGIKRFHLGGGYDSSEGNSLLKFKRAFSHENNEFYIGRLVFDNEKYQNLCDEWEKNNPDKIKLFGNRLLKYRY